MQFPMKEIMVRSAIIVGITHGRNIKYKKIPGPVSLGNAKYTNKIREYAATVGKNLNTGLHFRRRNALRRADATGIMASKSNKPLPSLRSDKSKSLAKMDMPIYLSEKR